MPPRVPKAITRRPVPTQAVLYVAGKIAIGPHLRYFDRKKKVEGASPKIAVCTFDVPCVYMSSGTMVEQWFSFIAFDRMAEYIATHYRRYDFISVLESTPDRRSKYVGAEKIYYLVWVVRKLGVAPGQGMPLPTQTQSGLTEVVFPDAGNAGDPATAGSE